MTVFYNKRNKKSVYARAFRKWVPITLLVGTGLMVTIIVVTMVLTREDERFVSQFRETAKVYQALFHSRVSRHLAEVDALRRFYEGSVEVDRKEFRSFVQPVLSVYPDIQALEWVPQVHDVDRRSHEARVRKEGLKNYEIREQTTQGAMIRASRRRTYYPVSIVEPLAGNEAAIGYDLGSEPTRLAALERARDTGRLTVTARIFLVQETEKQHGFLVFAPVYRSGVALETVGQRRENLQGFALGVFRVGMILEATIFGLQTAGIDIRLLDESAPDETRFLYFHPSRMRQGPSSATPANIETHHYSRIDHIEKIELGGRQWSMVFTPAPGYFAAYHHHWQAWLAFALGLLLTSWLTVYVTSSLRRAELIKTLVNQRTAQLRESETRQRTIFNTMADALIIVDDNGRIESLNPTAERMFGYSTSEVLGQHIEILILESGHGDYDALLAQCEAANEASNQSINREIMVRRNDGTVFPSDLSVSEMRLGGTRKITVIVRDITERKQAEKKSRGSQRMLQIVLDSVPVRVFWKDQDSVFLGCNQLFARDAGLPSPGMIIGKTDFDLVWAEQAELYRADDWRVMQSGEAKLSYEEPQTKPDGSKTWLETSKVPLTNLDGKVIGVLGTYHDITERKQIDRMKDEFISTVSHELRTPLTSIYGSLGLLVGGVTDELSEQTRSLLTIARNNADRLLFLINDILDIQKIESGEMAFNFRNIEVMPLIESAITDNAVYGEQHKVHFKITQRVDKAWISADQDRMMQVMSNLLSNGAKFSPEREIVEVAVARHGEAVRISITDHGSGIPASFQPRLFQRFAQADATDSRRVTGTGLGLSITKAIVEKHNGHIDFVTRQGVGTTFYLEFPEINGA